MSRNEIKTILLVEDSPEDCETTLRAFKKARCKNPILHCETGDEALDFLYNRGKYKDKKKYGIPCVILLDLNLPGTDGREVLRIIKADKKLRAIPVIVMTTSNDRYDIDQCYSEGANSYIQKPIDIDKYFMAIKNLKEYWFEIVVLPPVE
jgi:two-component system response regulator